MRTVAAAVVLLLASSAWAGMPTYRASGTFTAAAATCTAPMPAGVVANDILVLVVETENEAVSLGTANGFVEVTNSPQSAGTAATDPANRIAVYWKRAAGGDASPITTDSGNHQTCQIHAFVGVRTTGNPWNITAGGNDTAANDTTANIPGATTTADDALVVLVQGTSFNGTSTAECGAATNADLASILERTDNTNTSGLGGGHCLITGQKALQGAYTTTTLTLANTSFKGAMSVALEGAVSTGPPPLRAAMGVGQ